MTAALSLKALAERVLARVAKVEHRGGTHPEQTPEGRNKKLDPCSTPPARNSGALPIESSPAIASFQRRLAGARDWVDLHLVLTDAEMAYVNGELAGVDVDSVAWEAAAYSHRLPPEAYRVGTD